jgi:hypothetical protein
VHISKRNRTGAIAAAALGLAGLAAAGTVTATAALAPRRPPAQQQPAVLVPTDRADAPGPYQPPVRLFHFQDTTINEASGIADGRRNPGVLWTHNDSGDKPNVYALDRQGVTVGVFAVRAATAVDWEDMAWGPGPNGTGQYLFLGDIGDNNRRRTDCAVYRIAEPKIGARAGTREAPLLSEGTTVRIPFAYPDGPHDAEALMVHPKTGVIYLVTKESSGVAGVYKFPTARTNSARVRLTRVGNVTLGGEQHLFPNVVTGGDISPDGRKVTLVTYARAYEFTLPAGARNFDAIWKTRPAALDLPPLPQCEAVCYTRDGKSLLVTSEQTPAQVYRLDARR